MIFGIGIDIVDIRRINEMKSLQTFAEKILSDIELTFYNEINDDKKNMYLSKQFAAKEAFSKAVGTGISGKVNFKAINILRDSNGKPFCEFDDVLKKLLSDLGIIQSHVSLSDERDYAIAYVILEK